MVASPKPSVSTVETTNRWGGEGKLEQRSRLKQLTSVTLRVVASVITYAHSTNPTTFGNCTILAPFALHFTPRKMGVQCGLTERLTGRQILAVHCLRCSPPSQGTSSNSLTSGKHSAASANRWRKMSSVASFDSISSSGTGSCNWPASRMITSCQAGSQALRSTNSFAGMFLPPPPAPSPCPSRRAC